jgi:hypothetical protein
MIPPRLKSARREKASEASETTRTCRANSPAQSPRLEPSEEPNHSR